MASPAKSAASEPYSLLKLADAIQVNAAPEAERAAASELFASQVAQRKGGPVISARPGIPVPGDFTRDLVVGTASAGGNLTTQAVLTVEAATRPVLQLERLGAVRLIAPDASDCSQPIWTGAQEFDDAWIDENRPSNSLSALQVKTVSFSAKGCKSRVAYSRKVRIQSSTPIETAVLSEIQRAIAVTTEKGFLIGGGGIQPLGLLRTPGLSAVAFDAAVPDRAELCEMVQTAGEADADLSRAAWLLHPADLAALLSASLVETYSGHKILGFPVAASTNVPEGSYLFGDFSTCRCAYFGPPQFLADSSSGGKSIVGATEIVVISYIDFGMINPAHVVLGSA